MRAWRSHWDALTVLWRFAVRPSPERDLPAMGCLEVVLGEVCLERSQLEEAEEYLRRGLDRMGWSMNPYYLMVANAALFRLYAALDRPTTALDYLDRLEKAWPDISFFTSALRLRHALRVAPLEPDTHPQVLALSKRFSPGADADFSPPGLGPVGAAEARYQACLSWCHARIATGHPDLAIPILEAMLTGASYSSLVGRVIELNLLLALAARAQGDNQSALQALKQAVESANPASYLRIFDLGPGIKELLADSLQDPDGCPYAARILEILGLPQPSKAAGAKTTARITYLEDLGPVENLTGREMEVLELIAQGATNQAIAARLVISIGTVKSHVNHILAKLGAHNRTEAIARARRLGLV